jgi:hypothetical protein
MLKLRPFESILRNLKTLQGLIQYARKKTGVERGKSDSVKNGKPVKVTGAFIEPAGGLQPSWPRMLSKRVEVLGNVEEDASTLLALYLRPKAGGDIGEVAVAVKNFFRRNGITVRSTARGVSVIDDIVAGRLRS